jgi:hypothetical protein
LAPDLFDQLDQLDYLSFFERLNSVASVHEFNANRNVVDASRVIGDLRRRHDLRCGPVPANDVMSFVPGGLEKFSPELRIVVSLADGPELHVPAMQAGPPTVCTTRAVMLPVSRFSPWSSPDVMMAFWFPPARVVAAS